MEFMPRTNHNPAFRIIFEVSLHQILAHTSHEVISNVNALDYKKNLDRSNPTPKTTKYMTYLLAKSTRVFFRSAFHEVSRSEIPYHTLYWDAIVMEKVFNDDKYISHFYCLVSHFNFKFPCRSKIEFKFTFRTVLQLIKKIELQHPSPYIGW